MEKDRTRRAPGPSSHASSHASSDASSGASPAASSTRGPVAFAPARLRGGARSLVLQLAADARAEWAYTTDVLASAFRANRQLGSGERRLVAETIYGLVRWDRRLDAIVEELWARRRGPKEPLTPIARDELKLLVYELRQGGEGAEAPGPAPVDLVEDFRRIVRGEVDVEALRAEDAGLGTRTGLDREAMRLSYPTWLVERFANDWGQEGALALCAAMNRRAPLTIRVNTARISRDDLAARLLAEDKIVTRPTPLSPAGLFLETRVNAFGLRAFQDGLFEVMDEGSQLVGEAVAPPPGGRVVDACAGAGGKTLALGALMEGKGRILALDNAGKKLEELRRRARRASLSNVVAREVKPPALPDEARPGAWDRVLVDAPCSGLGTLRRNPEARWRLTPKAVDGFPTQQLSLLVTYAPLVAVGGRLVYATCTVLGTENEKVVERFLAERPDFVLVPLKELWGKERAEGLGGGTMLKLAPHVHETDGFFAAVLRRVR
jgi:16S rRNA (cytosine967-C5)-methyltransferase